MKIVLVLVAEAYTYVLESIWIGLHTELANKVGAEVQSKAVVLVVHEDVVC